MGLPREDIALNVRLRHGEVAKSPIKCRSVSSAVKRPKRPVRWALRFGWRPRDVCDYCLAAAYCLANDMATRAIKAYGNGSFKGNCRLPLGPR